MKNYIFKVMKTYRITAKDESEADTLFAELEDEEEYLVDADVMNFGEEEI